MRHGQGKGRFFVAEGVTRTGIFKLGNGHNGTGADGFLAGSLRFAKYIQRVAKALVIFGAGIF